MNREPFAQGMAAMASVWPEKKISNEGMNIYFQALQDIPDADWNRAVQNAIKREKFFPVPATLRELAGAGGELEPDQRARLAWQVVLETMQRRGAYYSVDFGPLVNRVVAAMGGWPYLCGLEREELRKWRVREFLDLFKIYEQAGGDGPASLSGIHEDGNRERGFYEFIPAPVRVALPGVQSAPALPKREDVK